jgi:hypothetical protein
MRSDPVTVPTLRCADNTRMRGPWPSKSAPGTASEAAAGPMDSEQAVDAAVAATAPAGPTAPAVSLAVPDASFARLPGQFNLCFSPSGEFVRHRIAAWSVGLKWLVFDYDNMVHNPASPLLKLRKFSEYLETEEQGSFEEYMREHLSRHQEMHEGALLQGLEPGPGRGLPVENILVDRLLKEMVQAADIDLHGPADTMGSDEDYIAFLASSLEYSCTRVGDRHFQLRQRGLGLPVVSTYMPIGRASYRGDALDLGHQVPEIICLSVAGRPLGDVVATGHPELDARVITKVVTSSLETVDHWPRTTETRFRFEPDLIELGERWTHGHPR